MHLRAANVILLMCVGTSEAICSSDADCCYAGTCDSTTRECVCDRGFGGGSCCTFQFQPAPAHLISKLPLETGFHDDYAWGGSVIQDAAGKYHMFKSVLLNRCPIQYYDTNSIIVHMTAATFLGPYIFRDVALRPRSAGHFDNAYVHAPFITQTPNRSFALYYETASLYHGNNYTTPDCTKGEHPAYPDPKGKRCMGVALSNSLDGPWLRQEQSILGDNCVPERRVTAAGDVQPGMGDVSNPAVLILPNASAMLLYRYEAANHECIGVAFCEHYAGRCKELSLPDVGLFPDWNGEDPYVWVDANSHVHVVYHCYVDDENPVGCHAVLRGLDGDWTDWYSPAEPAAYYRNVTWNNGSTSTLGRRERPQVLVRDGKPVALFSGATIQRGDSLDAATFTMGQELEH